MIGSMLAKQLLKRPFRNHSMMARQPAPPPNLAPAQK